jgi:predicted TPR repeat methyltransferase
METIHNSHKIENKEKLKEYYKKWSSTYDNDVKSCEYNGPETITNILTRNFNIYGSTILDVGCGTGLLADYLNKDKYQILIDGIDISNEMIEIANKRNYYNQISNIDVFDITSPQKTKYDYIISAGMFTHNHVGPNAIENILNYLESDGVFIFTVRNSFMKKENFQKIIVDLLKNGKMSKCSTIENQNYIEEEKCSVYTLFV